MNGIQHTPRRRGIVLIAVAALLLAVVAWQARVDLLRWAAHTWIVADAPAPADAVTILGGGLEVRPFAAAEYYRAGLVQRVLVPEVRPSPAERLGIVPPHSELNRKALLALGVPREAIVMFGHDLSSTREEALALRAWAAEARATAVIVPTELFSSRRVRWTMDRIFATSPVRVLVPARETHEYQADAWWRSEAGLIAFQNEVIKYLYYRLHGRDFTLVAGARDS